MGIKSVGVDVGGTFTDVIFLDSGQGTYRIAKVPTSAGDPAAGFMDGVAALGIPISQIDCLVHGTTTGTNAVLERKGAVCGLITTQGFRDVLELGRRTRPTNYGLAGSFEPLIPRELRLEVPERMDAAGRVVAPLDEDAVRRATERLQELGAESVVIHFMHAYANPDHERQCARLVRDLWPNAHVVAGHEIMREMREFERASTAAVHGLIRPVVTDYIARVATRLAGNGYPRSLLVMQANGGMMDSAVVGANAVHTIMSGPAAGVLAAAEIATASGFDNVITGDMGGTSYDVAVIKNATPVVTAEKDLAYSVPLRVPMIDINTIGAGGGSIAHVDRAGLLRVGPESAGSDPGPVAAARGGRRPTITDANLLLGRINAEAIPGAAGTAPLDRVETAIAEHVGDPLGLSPAEAAKAILDVAVNELAGAIRLVSIDKGQDPRDFALMPYGGAGPLHAVEIARELGIPTVIVPRFPGLTSALGCAFADVRHDFVQTLNTPLREVAPDTVDSTLATQAEAGRSLLAREDAQIDRVVCHHEFDLLYQGQSHVVRLPLRGARFDPEKLNEDLTNHYKSRFGITLPEMVPVLVNVRTAVVGLRERPDMTLLAGSVQTEATSQPSTRAVYFGNSWHEATVIGREALSAGSDLSGPAVIEQLDSTIVVDPGARARGDAFGNLLIDVRPPTHAEAAP